MNSKRKANVGLKTFNNDRFTRNDWEISDYKRWKQFLMTDTSSRYYYYGNYVVNWHCDGNELRSYVFMKNRSIEGETHFFRPGISWALRTSIFQPHIIPSESLASSGRFIAVCSTQKESIILTSLWNSEYFDYCIKLSMEWIDRPKFINGTVNKLPHPKLSKDFENYLQNVTVSQHARVKELYRTDDKSLAFTSNDFIGFKSLKDYTINYNQKLSQLKDEYIKDLSGLNDEVYSYFNISDEERSNIREIVSIAGNDDEGKMFNVEKSELIDRLFSVLVGCAFGRWDIRKIKKWQKEWSDEDMFKARKHSPFIFGQKESTLELILPEYHEEIVRIWKESYPIETIKEMASTKDLTSKLKEVINYFWQDSASTIEFELQDHFGVSDLEGIFTNPNKFFDIHLKDYTRNKRISPIYWPISTASGNTTIWLYYPKLNDQTLFKVVNDFILPKQQEVAEQIKKLENNPGLDNKGKKELLDNQNLFHELKDMEKDLLEVASLPYKPNHDDGVLITAAPLYRFFRHSKWKKATEECWKALQKGEYDWAHLAYSIWPERVTKKCKKDLSMAIAHGLEEICEVKPKEKKEKKVAKSTNKNIQGKLID